MLKDGKCICFLCSMLAIQKPDDELRAYNEIAGIKHRGMRYREIVLKNVYLL